MLLIAFTGFFVSLGCFAVLIYQDLEAVRKSNQQQEKLIGLYHTTTNIHGNLQKINSSLNCLTSRSTCLKELSGIIVSYNNEITRLGIYLAKKDRTRFEQLRNESIRYVSLVKQQNTASASHTPYNQLSQLRNESVQKIQFLLTAIEAGQRESQTENKDGTLIRNRTNVFIMMGVSVSILMFFVVNFFLLQLSLRKRADAERKSKKNEEKFETLFYHSPVMFLMVDAFSLEVVNANNNTLAFLNFGRDEIIGRRITDLNLFKSATDTGLIYKIVTENLQVRDHITSITLNNGETHCVSSNFDKVIIDERPTLFIAFFDITVQKQAEQAIKESQDQFATLFYKNPSILALTDIETNTIIDINERYSQFFGYSRDEVIGETAPVLTLSPNADTKSGSGIEIEVRTKTKAIKYVRYFAEIINIKGKKQKLVCLQDITDIRKTQAILKRSEEIYSSLFYKSPVILCISEARSGKFIDVNDNYCNFFKYKKEELIGITSRELKIWVKYSERIFMMQKLDAGEPVSNVELHFRAKDGEIKCVNAHVDMIEIDGRECLMCAFVDASEEKKARQEILKLNEVLEQRVIERTKEIRDYKYALDESAITVIADRNGHVQHVNDNFTLISKYTFREVAGRKIDILRRPSSRKVEREILTTIRKEKVWKGEIEQKAKDNSVYWTHTHIIPFVDARNEPYQYLIIGWDITQKKLAELENERVTRDLIQRNKNLEQYAYIISHNLRAPVSNIMGLVQLLQSEDISEDEREIFNLDLSLCINKLDEVIKDLNNILQSSRQVAETKEEINLLKMVSSIKGSIANLVEKEQTVIECDFNEVPCVYSTRSYLNSILYNLISNSIKYRKEDETPFIRVKSTKTNNSVLITYTDNGLGIDLDRYGDKVFGLYKRFHPHKEGRGMGLFMVKTQVETLGGKINIESKAGEGTTFIIDLPLSS